MGILMGDIKYPPISSGFADVVVCNPPYRRKASGRINPDPRRAIARHEIHASLGDILETAGRLLRPKGRLVMVYPTVRFVDLVAGMRDFNLEPKRIRIAYPDRRSEASLVLVEASLGGRPGVKVLPPIWDQGDFSLT
jgi:tRNA1(Val) A37 N6-methylase TrmN6